MQSPFSDHANKNDAVSEAEPVSPLVMPKRHLQQIQYFGQFGLQGFAQTQC
jgi:hypothetical protein